MILTRCLYQFQRHTARWSINVRISDSMCLFLALDAAIRSAHRVERLLSLIERTNTNIADDYDTWLRIGCSLASEYGESGRGYFHTVSRQSAKYHPTQCDRQYDHCMLNCSKSSIGTFFFICKGFNLTLSI